MSNSSIADDDQIIQIDVDLNIFSLVTIKKVCYRLSDIFNFEISKSCQVPNKVIVKLTTNTNINDEQIKQIRDDFNTLLIDYDLRETIRDETKEVRTLILANAFSNSTLMEE